MPMTENIIDVRFNLPRSRLFDIDLKLVMFKTFFKKISSFYEKK